MNFTFNSVGGEEVNGYNQNTNAKVKIFGVNYNIFRVIGGMGGLSFSN